MKKILAAVFVLSVWSQADAATKPRPLQLKPVSRVNLAKIALEPTNLRWFQNRPAALALIADKSLAKLLQPQKSALPADPYLILRKRYTAFDLGLTQPPKADYWQAGCGKFSFGRIYQGENSFYTLSVGAGLAPCSYQHGTYITSETIQSGLSLGGSFGGSLNGGARVINVPFASYTTTGFHNALSEGFKVESVGKGSPQAGMALTLTVRAR